MVDAIPKIAVACQGGGTHAAFEVGVLTEVLRDIQERNRFELTGLSGTSAGALCALMVWYGLASKNGRPGSARAATDKLNRFWDAFAATTPAEMMLNLFSFSALTAQEKETPMLGLNAPVFSLNPRGAISQAVTAGLPLLGVRKQYFDFEDMLAEACPQFDGIDWPKLQTRLLLGASEIIDGVETVFDSDCNIESQGAKHAEASVAHRWRKRLPVTLRGAAASGTLPAVREAEEIDGGYYWDGLYSQNPPVREFLAGVRREHVPDEIWIVRINPQQTAQQPKSNAEIRDRENELMGNLSLNKELDFILTVNGMIARFGGGLAAEYKPVTVRTIKMKEETAAALRTSSKFDRSRAFIDRLRKEGHEVAQDWLARWPAVGHYPDDAAYR
ncbi:MAG TPA: patatin-like phospholipase family protein [Rhodoplanes sp.]|nr:patatin-like phospholipase family protein [Rhodoplanes sp.]